LFYPPIIVKNEMKAFIMAVLLVLIIGNIRAVDIESYQFIDHLRGISKPGKPEIYEDGVLFITSSSNRRVGISFAHDGYGKVHWFNKLMIPRDTAEMFVNGKPKKGVDPNQDSGIMFHLEPIPLNMRNMDYRIIIDGLWTNDPLNPVSVTGPSGIVESRVTLPEKPGQFQDAVQPGTYRFTYHTTPGETVTVGGSFNNWDPFMYELREITPGFYTLTLPIPPGRFQYLFYHRGAQVPDPANSMRLYTREGNIVSEAIAP
jgi:hypothetical protein